MLKKMICVIALGCTVAILTGAVESTSNKNVKIVTTTYTVKVGDTLDSITGNFLNLNTGTKRRGDEFEEGIKQLNPWLKTPERLYGGLIYPGDEIQIKYFVKTNEGGE